MSPVPPIANPERCAVLKDRARMLREVRAYFEKAGVTEVDCPLLSLFPSLDPHIGVISATYNSHTPCYLHTSPEYAMKRLLSEGMGDIYQLSHVFRDGEVSSKHNPEFTMVEWYRVGWSLTQLQEETAAIISLFVGNIPTQTLSYTQALRDHAQIDLFTTPEKELCQRLAQRGFDEFCLRDSSRGDLLQLIFSCDVEPKLGQGTLTLITDYPPCQAELAQLHTVGGETVAQRFEAYYQGTELANGYFELLDAQEQRERFEQRNAQREALGKPALPIDARFLEALEKGVPPCSGVALGFDRLMMLRHHTTQIRDVLPFQWGEA